MALCPPRNKVYWWNTFRDTVFAGVGAHKQDVKANSPSNASQAGSNNGVLSRTVEKWWTVFFPHSLFYLSRNWVIVHQVHSTFAQVHRWTSLTKPCRAVSAHERWHSINQAPLCSRLCIAGWGRLTQVAPLWLTCRPYRRGLEWGWGTGCVKWMEKYLHTFAPFWAQLKLWHEVHSSAVREICRSTCLRNHRQIYFKLVPVASSGQYLGTFFFCQKICSFEYFCYIFSPTITPGRMGKTNTQNTTIPTVVFVNEFCKESV